MERNHIISSEEIVKMKAEKRFRIDSNYVKHLKKLLKLKVNEDI